MLDGKVLVGNQIKRLLIFCTQISYSRAWDYPENLGIYCHPDRKDKTWFCTYLNVYVSWIEQDNILMSQLSPLPSGHLQTKMDQKRSHEN